MIPKPAFPSIFKNKILTLLVNCSMSPHQKIPLIRSKPSLNHLLSPNYSAFCIFKTILGSNLILPNSSLYTTVFKSY